MADVKVRYDRAVAAERRSSQYELKLKLTSLKGVWEMFHTYSARQGNELGTLITQLRAYGVDIDQLEAETDAPMV